MRKLLGAVLMMLAACEVERPPAVTTQQRFELPGIPPFDRNLPSARFTGGTGAKLGTSVAACREEGYVAGAPGVSAVLVAARDAGVMLGQYGTGANASGLAVACDDRAGRRFVYTGGNEGLFVVEVDGGSSARLLPTPVTSLANAPGPNPRVLVGEPPGARLLDGDTHTVLSLVTRAGTAFGDAVAISQGSPRLIAVADPPSSEVHLYTTPFDGGFSPLLSQQFVSAPRVGAALAIGDVHPNPGQELLVASPETAEVVVYAAPSLGTPLQVLLTLRSPLPTGMVPQNFGAALALEPEAAGNGSLSAIWVGAPGSGTVTRFIGDFAEPSWELLGAAFGTAIAINRGVAVVGAPVAAGNKGQIYELPVGPRYSGEPMVCTPGAPCALANCAVGTCVGGVLCSDAAPAICGGCTVPERCTLGDAGVPPVGGGSGSTGGGFGGAGGGSSSTGGGGGFLSVGGGFGGAGG
ncbi:MAG: hypothetical protein ACO1OB_04900, partial [Archangium sp.]